MGVPYPFEHPYRNAVLEELHARPVDVVDVNVRVRRLVLTVEPRPGTMGAAINAFEGFARRIGVELQGKGARQFTFDTPQRHVTWEFHTEFITVTWFSALDDRENWPDDIGLDALKDAQLVGAMRVDLLDETSLPERVFPTFHEQSLCLVSVESGRAQLATDFVPDDEKFIRFEFAGAGLLPHRRALTLRRILEMETYRTMALLGLPLARETAPALRTAETQLTSLIENLASISAAEDVQQRLRGLQELSLRTGQISERLNYRFAASYAYGAILRRRLEKLREASLGQGSSLSSFIGNRVEPALATCEAMDKRLATLSDKVARGIDLLDARIGLDMQIQNKAVLEAIAETASSQYKLQRTVEGLSTIAISYYLLGILSYALSGPLHILGWDKTWTISIVAPFVLLGVWLLLRAIRKSH